MSSSNDKVIRVRGAREHNLQTISIDIPRDQLVVITGLSGSGKSSLAFDTLYAEGQRRYVESLSAYARQFLDQMSKPDVEHIEGLPPTISIEQRSGTGSPRSTVATTTEIYDFLRLLYARVGEVHCWQCGRPIQQQTVDQVVDSLLGYPLGTRLMLLAPVVRGRKGEHRDVFRKIRQEGFTRVRLDGTLYELDEVPELKKTRKHTIEVVCDRVILRDDSRKRLADSVEVALRLGEGLMIAMVELKKQWTERLFSALYSCPHCDISMEELTPRMFSFNSPYGACQTCHGLGTHLEFDPDLVVPDKDKSLNDGAIDAWRRGGKNLAGFQKRAIRRLTDELKIDADTPWKDLSATDQKTILFGSRSKRKKAFPGVIPSLMKRFEKTASESLKRWLLEYMAELPCPDCQGRRLRPEPLAVRFCEKTIDEVTSMSVESAVAFFSDVTLPRDKQTIARQVLIEIRRRLEFMLNVGLGYLTLDRISSTLSGGEMQRIRLATQVGSGLVGVCYVLDEPSIGLHQRDNRRLLDTLTRLRDSGNSVLVVEHDEHTMRLADHIVDLGPGAGEHGGHVVAQGTVEEIIDCPESVTGAYLSGRAFIKTPTERRKAGKRNAIRLTGCAENNLKKINVAFPLETFICVTGVSGSGKSTLVDQILYRVLARELNRARTRPGAYSRVSGLGKVDRVIEIDQSPIGRTPRSNPATYTGVFDAIRNVFAQTREARVRGYKAGRFSFNVKGGRCEACQGQGTRKIEMHFLPDIYVTCQQCRGLRYNRETLEVTWHDKTIADVLAMTVEEALGFFDSFPKITRMLQTLFDVGLGYVCLGQSAPTLSGGESQRVKLASELGRVSTGKTVYILDEPTTGLHFADISKLLEVLKRLAELGNTVIVIEHNLDVIKTADWIIDLGPEGGDAGGTLVAEGPPEKVARNKTSYTGQFLKEVLEKRKNKRGKE